MPQIYYQQKQHYKKKNSQQLTDQHKTNQQHTVYLYNGRTTKSNNIINRLWRTRKPLTKWYNNYIFPYVFPILWWYIFIAARWHLLRTNQDCFYWNEVRLWWYLWSCWLPAYHLSLLYQCDSLCYGNLYLRPCLNDWGTDFCHFLHHGREKSNWHSSGADLHLGSNCR